MVGAALAIAASPGDTAGIPGAVEAALRGPLSPAREAPAPATTVPAPAAVEESLPSSTVVPEEPEPAIPGESASLDVAASQPVGLHIDVLDVEAPVGAYGVVAGTGQMDVPDNVTDVAWYKFGPSPGQAGSAVLAAHVDLAGRGPGVFSRLRTLEPDDLVHVVYEDGAERAFRVVGRTVYDKAELPTEVLFAKDGPPVLTLITCGGAFSRVDRRYEGNVVVYAVPVDAGDFPAGGAGRVS